MSLLELCAVVFTYNAMTFGNGPGMVPLLQADLVDFMHLVIVPITLGRGVSLWEGSSGLEDRFTIESVTSPSGLTHQLWNKNDHV